MVSHSLWILLLLKNQHSTRGAKVQETKRPFQATYLLYGKRNQAGEANLLGITAPDALASP
jgi:hypothetical protein